MNRAGRGRDSERGSATVLAAALVAALLCSTAAGSYLGSAVVARHRAQAAADLAALAAAARLPAGTGAACAGARLVAEAMATELVGCAVDGLDVVATAEVGLAGLDAVGGWHARAAARAGPAETG